MDTWELNSESVREDYIVASIRHTNSLPGDVKSYEQSNSKVIVECQHKPIDVPMMGVKWKKK